MTTVQTKMAPPPIPSPPLPAPPHSSSSPVPEGDDVVGEVACLVVVVAGQPEVGQLEDAPVVDEQVRALDVAVQHLVGVAEQQPREQLLHVALPQKPQGSGFRVQGSGFRVQGSGFRVFVLICTCTSVHIYRCIHVHAPTCTYMDICTHVHVHV